MTGLYFSIIQLKLLKMISILTLHNNIIIIKIFLLIFLLLIIKIKLNVLINGII